MYRYTATTLQLTRARSTAGHRNLIVDRQKEKYRTNKISTLLTIFSYSPCLKSRQM
jgi:hypothetical protein